MSHSRVRARGGVLHGGKQISAAIATKPVDEGYEDDRNGEFEKMVTRLRSSKLRLATNSARRSSAFRTSLSVQPGVQRVAWLDVTSSPAPFTTGRSLVCNHEAARSIPVVSI